VVFAIYVFRIPKPFLIEFITRSRVPFEANPKAFSRRARLILSQVPSLSAIF
jgi:hypothetical protein